LTDKAYATLLHKLAKRNFDLLTPQLGANLEKLKSAQATQSAARPGD
jgi:hypothetical protein